MRCRIAVNMFRVTATAALSFDPTDRYGMADNGRRLVEGQARGATVVDCGRLMKLLPDVWFLAHALAARKRAA
jgi:hypothetical protein